MAVPLIKDLELLPERHLESLKTTTAKLKVFQTSLQASVASSSSLNEIDTLINPRERFGNKERVRARCIMYKRRFSQKVTLVDEGKLQVRKRKVRTV